MAFASILGINSAKFKYKALSSDVKNDARQRTESFWNGKTARHGTQVALLVALVIFSFLVVLVFNFALRGITDAQCARQISTYSPAFEAVEYIEYNVRVEQFGDSEYRGHPTPEMDRKWADLWQVGAVDVPLDKIPQLNQTPSDGSIWKPSPKDKGNGSTALLEVFHQLHCLDMIRRYTYLETYEAVPGDFHDDPAIRRAHIDHCIEAIRISLMCTSDVTLLLIELNSERGEHANFNNHRKCRDFEKILEWNVRNEVVK